MDEVLSQSEIDMLLNAINTGELSQDNYQSQKELEKVKEYDFRRPNKFSKEQLRTLYLMYENFSRLTSNFLTAYLRTSVQLKIASVDQLTYEDFALSLPSPTLLTFFNMEPLSGSAVLETSPGFIFPMIDLLFGGRGSMPKKVRELTDIEIGVLKNLYGRILENNNFIWSDINEVKSVIQGVETNPQLNQIISPNETVAVITLTSNINGSEGFINLCLPFVLLEPIISKLTAKHWLASIDKNVADEYRGIIRKKLSDVNVELTSICGKTNIRIRDFLQLQVGDIITLDNLVGQDLPLLVDDKVKFKVQPGIYGRKMAVQVTACTLGGAEE